MIADDPTVIKSALADLKKAFKSGKTRPIEYRKQQLQNLKRGVKELEPRLHEAFQKDHGIHQIISEMMSVNTTMNEIDFCLANVNKWVKPESTDVPLLVGPGKSYIQPEPLGVVLIMGTWNFPLPTSIPYVASAIAAGNCCIIKPSELSPTFSQVIAELFDKYLDKDCFRCIEGQIEVAQAIVSEPFDIIIFTGSTEKGRLVAEAAAKNLVPVILELGGKSPTIVDKNADLDNAAYRIMQGRFINSGQACMACDFVLAHKDIKEQLIQKFKQKLLEYYGEDPYKSKDYSRIITQSHVKRLKSYLDEDHGGKILVGGQSNIEEKYLAPTLVDNPKLTSKMMQEEIFGPILPILEFDDFDYVINFITDRPKPLSLYYYGSASSQNYKRLKTETSSGAVVVNDSLMHVTNYYQPFGGVGFSGYGKLHGYYGFKALSHCKTILEKGTINSFPFNVRYPPHDESKSKVLRYMMKASKLTQNTLKKTVLAFLMLLVLIILLSSGLGVSMKHSIGDMVSNATKTNRSEEL